MVNLTYKRNFAEKKAVSSVVYDLTADMFSGNSELELGLIPPTSLITEAYLHIQSASQVGVTFVVKVDATQIFSQTGAAVAIHVATPKIVLGGSDGKVTIAPSTAPTTGVFTLTLKFIEYEKGSGELTNYIK